MKACRRRRTRHACDGMQAWLVCYVVRGCSYVFADPTMSSEWCPVRRTLRRQRRSHSWHDEVHAFASDARGHHAMDSYVSPFLFVVPSRTLDPIRDAHVVSRRHVERLLGFLPFQPDRLLTELPFEPRLERNEPDRPSFVPSPLAIKSQFTFRMEGSLPDASKVSRK